MKKITLIALFCALFMAPTLNAQEVTYVQDPSQGYLVNKFKDNWFISAEAGAGVFFSPSDSKLGLGKRITPSFNLSVGKWFSPIIGIRIGADVYKAKGMTGAYGLGITPESVTADGLYEQKFWQVGPAVDVLVNLTNWWCGYHPGRVYNAIGYIGFSAHFAMNNDSFKNMRTNMGARVGLLNTFAISKQVDFLLDLRVDLAQTAADGAGQRQFNGYGTVMAGFAYKFKKRDWVAPTVPVCPEYKYSDAEGDALVARLQAADSKISSLESQLKACMNRPAPKAAAAVVDNAPLATIYFPIGSAKVSSANVSIAKAVAKVMKQNADKKYVVTGWADSYTGNAKINDRIRTNRANAVAKILTKNGATKGQIEVKTSTENLTDFGKPSASLDRAVTITNAE